MLSILKFAERLKLVLPVLLGRYIVISKVGSTLKIDAGQRSKEEVKDIASVFFKEAYNLQ